MAARVYWIDGPWKGRLAIVPRPRGGDWLEDDSADWREAGIDVVVSFLTPDEAIELDLEAEQAFCEAQGIRFVSFAIPDRNVPASQVAAVALVRELGESLVEGKTVAVHCRQSVGRSALLAACLLASAGEQPHLAFERISLARGVAVPDTAEQVQWLVDRAALMITKERA
jgi:protein-tyrosine phosphatase